MQYNFNARYLLNFTKESIFFNLVYGFFKFFNINFKHILNVYIGLFYGWFIFTLGSCFIFTYLIYHQFNPVDNNLIPMRGYKDDSFNKLLMVSFTLLFVFAGSYILNDISYLLNMLPKKLKMYIISNLSIINTFNI